MLAHSSADATPSHDSWRIDLPSLPEPVWTRLNLAWIAFFIFCGAANLFVAFTFQDYWVDFKVFGSLGMTVLFLVAQGIYLSRHLHDTEPTTPKTED